MSNPLPNSVCIQQISETLPSQKSEASRLPYLQNEGLVRIGRQQMLSEFIELLGLILELSIGRVLVDPIPWVNPCFPIIRIRRAVKALSQLTRSL